ncbi:MAG: hypothetical protein AAF191_08120 [Verrucomicrobiota bacterium]
MENSFAIAIVASTILPLMSMIVISSSGSRDSELRLDASSLMAQITSDLRHSTAESGLLIRQDALTVTSGSSSDRWPYFDGLGDLLEQSSTSGLSLHFSYSDLLQPVRRLQAEEYEEGVLSQDELYLVELRFVPIEELSNGQRIADLPNGDKLLYYDVAITVGAPASASIRDRETQRFRTQFAPSDRFPSKAEDSL